MAGILSMEAFVTRISELTAPAADSGMVQRFLGTHLIEPVSIERYVRFEGGRDTRHLVFKNSAVVLLVLCWSRGSSAPIHGHEGELCWATAAGYASWAIGSCHGTRSASRALGHPVEGGPGHVDGPAEIHAVETIGEDAMTLHVYVKPYEECDIHGLARGAIRRVRLGDDSVPEHPAAL